MSFSDTPILRQFRVAGKLINEHRDTLFYMGLTVAAGVGFLQTGAIDDNILKASVLRECLRGISWLCWKEPLLAGASSKPMNNWRLSQASLAVANGLLIFQALTNAAASHSSFSYLINNSLNISGDMAIGTLATMFAGGPRGIIKAYRYMWDYPRKKGGGGTTQTQRVKDAFSNLGRDIVRGLAGLTRQPVPARVTVRPSNFGSVPHAR
jgi:hypothetical protein